MATQRPIHQQRCGHLTVATLPQLTNACRRRHELLGPVSADSLCIGDRRAAPACCHHQLSTSLSNVAISPQVIRGSGPGQVAGNVGRLRDGAWELRFDSEETAGYAEALMEQHEAKARAHLCEVCVQPAMMLTQAGIAAVPAGLFGMERGLPRGNYWSEQHQNEFYARAQACEISALRVEPDFWLRCSDYICSIVSDLLLNAAACGSCIEGVNMSVHTKGEMFVSIHL